MTIYALTETDWTHIENILFGVGYFIAFVFFMWLIFRD